MVKKIFCNILHVHVYGLLAVRLSKFSEIVDTWINRGIEYYAYNK